MATQVGIVKEVSGNAFAKSPDGGVRQLSVNSVVFDDEIIIGNVTLTMNDGSEIHSESEIRLDENVFGEPPTAVDAVVDTKSVDTIIQALDRGEDLSTTLDATAAGLGAGGEGAGSSFVMLSRILETVNGNQYRYGFEPLGVPEVQEGTGEPDVDRQAVDVAQLPTESPTKDKPRDETQTRPEPLPEVDETPETPIPETPEPEDPEVPTDPPEPEEPPVDAENPKDNNGHGNNTDGQDDNNPGQGGGGPNSDPKDDEDEDEKNEKPEVGGPDSPEEEDEEDPEEVKDEEPDDGETPDNEEDDTPPEDESGDGPDTDTPDEPEDDETEDDSKPHQDNGKGNGVDDAPGNSGNTKGDDADNSNTPGTIDTGVEDVIPMPVDKPKGNNGWGNGDQNAPGNSLDNNNAENSTATNPLSDKDLLVDDASGNSGGKGNSGFDALLFGLNGTSMSDLLKNNHGHND